MQRPSHLISSAADDASTDRDSLSHISHCGVLTSASRLARVMMMMMIARGPGGQHLLETWWRPFIYLGRDDFLLFSPKK